MIEDRVVYHVFLEISLHTFSFLHLFKPLFTAIFEQGE